MPSFSLRALASRFQPPSGNVVTLRKALLINFAQNYGIIALQFTGSIILARLLSPGEIGIFSVASALIALAQAVRDFGVGQYIIQERELTQDRLRAAFSVSLLVAVVLAAITAGLSGVAADFYREPGVRNVMLVLSLNFLLIPFGQITLGYLQREMNFAAVAQVKIGSTVVHFGVSLAFAYAGHSYMSLAYASLANVLASAAIANLHRPAEVPWRMGFGEVRRVLNFGSLSVVSNLAGALAKGTADLVIGRMMSLVAVGLFSRAGGLIEIFNQGVMNALWAVALPHFSKTVREGGDVRGDYLRSAGFITGVAWPFFVVLALLGEPVVLLLYGEGWKDCIPLVKWFCLAYWVIAPFYLFSSVLIAIGQIGKVMWVELASLPVQFGLYVAGALTGDLEAVAAASVAYQGFKAVFVYLLLSRHLGFRLAEFAGALWRSLGVTVGTAGITFPVVMLSESIHAAVWLQILLGGGAATLAWMLSIFVLRHSLRGEALALIGRGVAVR